MPAAGSPKTVFVTGASSGIGAAVAQRFVERGDRVFGTSRSARPDGDGIEWLAVNVQDDASVDLAVTEMQKRCDSIDVAVLCAGFGIFGSVEDVSIEAAKEQFETNYFGVLRSMRALLPAMRAQGHGRILIATGGRGHQDRKIRLEHVNFFQGLQPTTVVEQGGENRQMERSRREGAQQFLRR